MRNASSILLVSALMLSAACPQVSAQSTDGFHAIQIVPVVVDTATFVTQLVFESYDATHPTVDVRYFPAEGTSQAAPLTCATVTSSYEPISLRTLCPNLAAGSQFGFLYLSERSKRPFAVHARVANAKGIGFSVEGFPAHTFTSAGSMVSGLRRMAATANSPAYQTNCFIGNLNQLNPSAPVSTTVAYQLSNMNGSLGAGSVSLQPGKLTRLLSVFDLANVAPGDQPNATIRFEEVGEGEPGLMAFCTVQDNTSFGADFRIAKQTHGNSNGSLVDSVAQDDGALRESLVGSDIMLATGPDTSAARSFSIPPGNSSNAHVFYFRHPDWIGCWLIDPVTRFQVLESYGLEMRLMASDGKTVIAGGNNVVGFDNIYMGDKGVRDQGANTRYSLEVESNGQNAASARPYLLHCMSGSGHGLGELVRTGGPSLF